MKKRVRSKDDLRDLRYKIDTWPAFMIHRNRWTTEIMMKEVVARAERGEDMPFEVLYFVEPFRAYLSGKNIETALYLTKRKAFFSNQEAREK